MQETVAQLGELDADGRSNARLLAQQITGTDQQRELFEPADTDEQRIAVRLDRVCIGATPFRWTVLGLRLDSMFAESFRS